MTVLGPGYIRHGLPESTSRRMTCFYSLLHTLRAQSHFVPDLKLWYSKTSISRALALETRS